MGRRVMAACVVVALALTGSLQPVALAQTQTDPFKETAVPASPPPRGAPTSTTWGPGS